MEIIGEDLHLLNPAFLQAMEKRDEVALVALARQQVKNGATALDVNLGQSRKLGRLTPWLVETIQGAVNVPLFLANHVLQQQRALEVHKGQATINAVTANQEHLVAAMETAKYFSARLVVLLVSAELTPTDVNGRLFLATQVLDTAARAEFPLSQLYLDPVIACRPDPVSWQLSAGLPDIDTIVDTITMVNELTPEPVRTMVAISNASLCLAKGDRSLFHCRLLPLLFEAGLDAAIMNCRDESLMAVVRRLRHDRAA